MVRARLHLICGNCGCNDGWECQYQPENKIDGEIVSPEDVWLWCGNCSTLHTISDNSKILKVE